MLDTLILDKNHSYETKTCLLASMVSHNPIQVLNISYENLDSYQELLQKQSTLPVGSVEFIEKCILLANKNIPDNLSYPKEFNSFLNRKIISTVKKEVVKKDGVFIKPQKTKQFTGFCFYQDHSKINKDNLEDLNTFLSLPDDSTIFMSEIIQIEQEYRIYIENNQIIGVGRYDEHDSKNKINTSIIDELLKKSTIQHPFTLDVGIYNNEHFLIECNDAWAIGLYEKCLTPKAYLHFLYQRWLTI